MGLLTYAVKKDQPFVWIVKRPPGLKEPSCIKEPMSRTLGFQEPIEKSFKLLIHTLPSRRRRGGGAREEQMAPRTLAEEWPLMVLSFSCYPVKFFKTVLERNGV
jgi:hypothetical protein